jgi:hypothetical protein
MIHQTRREFLARRFMVGDQTMAGIETAGGESPDCCF